MIVECISDAWEDAPNPRPIKGNLYEVVWIKQIPFNSKAPYFGLAEIRTGIIWSNTNFREVDINIDEIKEVLQDKVEV